jgi:hypothetical protein
MTPVRVQQSRRAGWRKPPHTVCVSRPTRFGNYVSRPAAKTREVHAAGVAEFRAWATATGQAGYRREVRARLRGRNPACYCPPGWPCHADVLLAIANGEETA